MTVGGNRREWLQKSNFPELCASFPCLSTDRDIVAIHPEQKRLIIAEVEGESSGQPEQKLYKAIGQLVLAVANTENKTWQINYVIVVHGEKIARHLGKASILQRLRISALSLASEQNEDEFLFGITLKRFLCLPL